MAEIDTTGPARVPIALAAAMTVAAGSVGWLTDRAAIHADWPFPSTGYLVGELVWKAWTFVVLAWILRRRAETLGTRSLGLKSDPAQPRHRYPILLAVLVAAGAIALSTTIGSSATSARSFGPSHHVGLALALAELLVRYPLTVFVEEAFFRGWMQPRLGPNGPVLSALLWGVYHLQQIKTIPSIVVLGLGLGLVRWWTRNVRLTGLVHFASNAAFFVSNYL